MRPDVVRSQIDLNCFDFRGLWRPYWGGGARICTPGNKLAQCQREPGQRQTKKAKKQPREARRSSPWCREGRIIWRGQVEGGGGEGGEVETGCRDGTRGVMDQHNEAPAGPEETGAKAVVPCPGLCLLQQVGCWPLNLCSWVSNGTHPPPPSSLPPLTF